MKDDLDKVFTNCLSLSDKFFLKTGCKGRVFVEDDEAGFTNCMILVGHFAERLDGLIVRCGDIWQN
jgi:hypothetical protein